MTTYTWTEIEGSMNDNIHMDTEIEGSMNDNIPHGH